MTSFRTKGSHLAISLAGLLAAIVVTVSAFAQAARYELADGPSAAGPVLLVPEAGGPWVSYQTIKEAVDAASPSGDTVLLTPGVYRGPGNRDVHVTGKNLRIEHRGDPARCVIDAEGLGIGFFFLGTGVTKQTLLRGITVANGQGIRGGGISCENGATPRIESCVVRQCRAGIGGGIYYGVDFGITSASGSIADCTIQDNFSTSGSGGLHIANVNIDRCIIVDNASDFIGAGVGVVGAFGSIRNSVIARNQWTAGQSSGTGGGMMVQGFQFQIESCTIAYNKGRIGGGVAFFNGDPTATMANTIVWGNEVTTVAPQIWHMSAFGMSAATFRHCDIEGGEAGIVVQGLQPSVTSIFDLDPEFLGGSAGDFQLSPGSPLIELGDPLLAPRPNEGDSQLEPRRFGLLDLGADEVHPLPSLTLPSPGRAGETNAWTVRGASPGAWVLFLAGGEPGAPLPYERCPTLPAGLAGPSTLGMRLAPPSGSTTLRGLIPAQVAGERLLFQAFTFDPTTRECAATELVPFSFP